MKATIKEILTKIIRFTTTKTYRVEELLVDTPDDTGIVSLIPSGTLAIYWSVEDFKIAAIQEFEWIDEDDKNGASSWDEYYDEDCFYTALEDMILNHDCEQGITWETVRIYLNDYCKKDI